MEDHKPSWKTSFLGNEAEYEDLKVHDYKKDLESRERKAREERNKEKHYKTSGR